jgi:hypothetical protein
MPRDPRIDAYIAKAAPFAQPILRHLREVVHEGCPEVEETMKWSFPHFMYKGMFCSMAAFKEHAAFGFWKSSLVMNDSKAAAGKAATAVRKTSKSAQPKAGNDQSDADSAMGVFGRLTSVQDLPSRAKLLGYVKTARRLNDEGVKVEKAAPKKYDKSDLEVPGYFMAAVRKNKKSLATWDAFPYSKRKDYVQWVSEAKSDETRNRRLDTTIEWLAEGKARNWKYEKC